jgi:hypothetical protein
MVNSRRSRVDQFSPSFIDQDLQVDENLGYGQKRIALRHLEKNISHEVIERACPLVKGVPDKLDPLPVVLFVHRNQPWQVSDVFPVPGKHILYVQLCKLVERPRIGFQALVARISESISFYDDQFTN